MWFLLDWTSDGSWCCNNFYIADDGCGISKKQTLGGVCTYTSGGYQSKCAAACLINLAQSHQEKAGWNLNFVFVVGEKTNWKVQKGSI